MKDVMIVGAGPGGATAAALLARQGVDVLLVDKDEFPRFHIGESLLPCDLALFERLGIDMKAAGFLYKGGAEFFDERTGDHAVYLFKEGLQGTPGYAYQVERAKFDALVLDRAKEAGAKFVAGVRVRSAIVSSRFCFMRAIVCTRECEIMLLAVGRAEVDIGRRGGLDGDDSG